MHIGILTLQLSIETAESLKDKRQIVRSLLQHLRNRFNVSAAEVDDLSLWRRATLGIAVVSNEARYTNQVLSQVVNHVESDVRVVLNDYAIEILPFSGGEAPSEEIEDETAKEDFTDWFPTELKNW
jgi:uncharacterized protein YlxP (DUF503 family)